MVVTNAKQPCQPAVDSASGFIAAQRSGAPDAFRLSTRERSEPPMKSRRDDLMIARGKRGTSAAPGTPFPISSPSPPLEERVGERRSHDLSQDEPAGFTGRGDTHPLGFRASPSGANEPEG